MRIQAHVISQHSQNDSKILCPLCQEDFKEKRGLEKHLMNTHSVKPEGLQRLLLMVDQGDWMMPPTSIPTITPYMPIDESGEINTEALEAEAARLAAEEAIDTAALPDKYDTEDQYRCQTCSKTFCNIDALYAHQNELGHLELKQTPRGPGYLCWKKGCNQYFKTAQALQVHFREIHAKRQTNITDHSAYKYECNQCSLAFKSPEKLQLHSHYHLIQAATRCSFCTRSFRSISALRKHVDTGHSEISETEKEQYHASMNVASMALGAMLKQSGMENLAEMISNSQSEGSTTTVNAITSPVVSTVQSDKLLAKTDMNSNETLDKIDEKMDMDNSSQDENDDDDDDDENMDTSEKEDGSDMPYKEQQFLEDYINSQAIAENSYEDPARKFKCHRCKLAFTKQTYLTAHNKTLLHRRGDKMSYPMEKYLDPNRPFKCDVCKESFTQKNILLVHYNSVSHLHKLKQITHGSPSSTSASQENSESEAVNMSSSTMNGDSDKPKPYKCNICKVSYSQGSTLDIHIRSVGHQTKASKLQELVLTGQVDIMQPLIEQPNDGQMSQQQKILSEMLAQQPMSSMASSFNPSLLFPGMPSLGDFGQFPITPGLPLLLPKTSLPETVTTSSTSTKSTTSIKSEKVETVNGEQEEMNGLHVLAQAAANNDIVKRELNELVKESPSIIGPTYLCQLCNAVFTNQDSLQQHQIICMYQAGCFNAQSSQMKSRGYMGRVKPQVHRNLLENIGFECVMQFNEFNNQPASMRDDVIDNADAEVEVKEIKEEKDAEIDKKEDLPELNKGKCPTCHKEFSSVWVLKAHQEEVHKEVVPTTFVEDFGEQFINDMDLKQAKENESQQSNVVNDPTTVSVTNGEGGIKEMPPPPPPPPPMMNPQIDISQMMPMFSLGMQLPVPMNMAMMNMQPQLMPMMFPVSAAESMTSPMAEGIMSGSQSKMNSAQQQAAAAAAMQNQNKRARTRINDEQLKVLRGYFDINNSPSEEQIISMSDQSGLPTKVIKHWFRNTLFKERQRNKDSPYNFNNPPLTTLDLEEYEKTGKLPTSDDPSEITIKKEPDCNEEIMPIVKIPPKEAPSTLSEIKSIPPTIVSLPLIAPAPIKLEPPSKCESPKSQDPSLEDSDSMSNSSAPNTSTFSSAPPPLVNINMSTALSFNNTNSEEIRPRFEFSPHHSAYNKRANRTRFTDYQIKVLQEYFEQNAYPKDDELDHLSKVLNLSPRVIVVWFQNARQKARKIYENQPNADVPAKETNSSSPFNRTPGLNYQCKKCTAVFQRYYDLIRHQKKHCSADADKSMSVSTCNDDYDSDSLSSMSKDDLNQSEDGSMNSYELSGEPDTSTGIRFNCEKCNKSFEKLEAWRDHQSIHMSSSLFSEFSTNSAFGVLQNMAAAQQQESDKIKRKYEVFEDDDNDQPRDKRLRTTILPEQLDYLYQKYQLDCNPSRKQLEHISRDVCLKKRVVQVWFQNTRARERKGQYRAHQQLIHKRCPFCRALFRAKSALESHLATKHPEEMAKGDINIDNIPDAALESPSESMSATSTMFTSTPTSADFSKLISPQSMQSFLPILPSPSAMPGLPNDPLQLSMTKFYADSFKKYMSDLSASEPKEEEKMTLPSPVKTHDNKPKPSTSNEDDEAPLDLSKPLKVKVENEKNSDGPSTDISENSNDNMNSSRQYEDSSSDVSMNKSDYYNSHMNTSGPSSPVLSTHSNSLSNSQANKRYRTQMTSLQVRIMKTIFVDYKTPTMAECEMLGRIIGLQKRVVQVWFQNARAKEKKSKLQMSKTYGTTHDLDFHKPPEECKLCNFKYSHKYTIQDHIFTKKHIENVRIYVQSQSEAESHITSQGMAGLTGTMTKPSDRKQWDDQSSQSHLAQLQSMGMNSLGMPLSGLPGLGPSFNPSEILKKEKDTSGDKKSAEGSNKDLMNMDPAQLAAMMSSPFSGFFPGIDPAMLPYMYAGFPAYMPGMSMPFMPPGFMPGAEQMMGYDPMSFGTPLPLLQIPQQAIKDVSIKLSEPKATVAQYTQDCKSISSLKSLVNNVDYLCVRESTVDVGYICKKCQMVYPGKEACVGHQRTMCFPGGKIPENVSPMLKLEQIQYECKLCSDKSSTVHEYKTHCQSEGHKAKTTRLQQKTGKLHSPVSSVPQSPSKMTSSSNSSMSPLPKSDIGSPSFSRPKDNASNVN